MPEKGALHSRTGGKVFLCSFLMCDASIRSLARNGLLHSSTSGSCKKISRPLPSPPSKSSHSLARWDPDCSQNQAGDHLGRIHLFTLLLFALSVRVDVVHGILHSPRVYVLACQSKTKEFSVKRVLVLFCWFVFYLQ